MEKRTKNRLALLGSLLVIGLILAGIGSALGAGDALKGTAKDVRAVLTGNQVTIYEDGGMIQNFTLPEGQEYTWETSSGGISIGKITSEEIQRKQAEHETELNKLLNIAKNDSRVQELIAGKDYKITGVGGEGKVGTEKKMGTAVLTFNVGGKYYRVTLDVNSETVKSIEEQASPVMTVCYGEGCNK